MTTIYQAYHRALRLQPLKTLLFLLLLVSNSSCRKLVDVEAPLTYTTGEVAYASDANAIAVINGLYADMSRPGFSSFNEFMSFYAGLSADEFSLYSGVTNQDYIAYYHNSLQNNGYSDIWTGVYPLINRINVALEGISSSAGLSAKIKNELTGEAKFLRAWHYFYLVNLYGDVPLVLGTDYKVNALLPRSPAADVYRQITTDLQDAQNLLADHFVGPDGFSNSQERVVPNKWAAKALLARVYLFTKDNANALKASAEVIGNTGLFSLEQPANVFLANSQEAIWQMQPVAAGWNTPDAQRFIIPAEGPDDNFPVALSQGLINSFEPGDLRLENWVGSVIVGDDKYYFAYKYKSNTYQAPVTEYQMVMRLAEQYLIRAEANAGLGNEAAALADLNKIRSRAGLAAYNGATDPASLRSAILKERRTEFFAELGHRWLDLKRTGTVNQVMSAAAATKGGRWRPEDQLYPIRISELNTDPNLVQNPGY